MSQVFIFRYGINLNVSVLFFVTNVILYLFAVVVETNVLPDSSARGEGGGGASACADNAAKEFPPSSNQDGLLIRKLTLK